MPAPASALRNDIIAETFVDLCGMVYSIAHRFSRQYQVRFDDLLSLARVEFVRACDSFNPKKGTKLSSWIYSKVAWALLSYIRHERRHKELVSLDELIEAGSYHPAYERISVPEGFIWEFKTELSRSASRVVDLVTNSTDDFILLLRWNKALTSTEVKNTISEHLVDSGWEKGRVRRCIQEINSVLEDWNVEARLERKKEREKNWLLSKVGLTPREVRQEVGAKGIRDFVRTGGGALLADEMGLGKSFQVLLWATRYMKERPMIIVCPGLLKWNWATEAQKHLGLRTEILSGRKIPKVRLNKAHAPILIINYEILHNWVDYLVKLKIYSCGTNN